MFINLITFNVLFIYQIMVRLRVPCIVRVIVMI